MRQLQLLDHRRNLCQRFVPFSIQLHPMFCNVPSSSLPLLPFPVSFPVSIVGRNAFLFFLSFSSFFSPGGTVAVGGLRRTTTSANVAGAPVVAKTCPKLSQNPFLHSLFRIDLFSQPGQRVAQPSDLLWGVGEAHNRQKNQLAHKNRKQQKQR